MGYGKNSHPYHRHMKGNWWWHRENNEKTMKKFYVTFGQIHPLSEGYVVVKASNYDEAREFAFEIFGQKFSFIREEIRAEFFPAGQYGKTIYA